VRRRTAYAAVIVLVSLVLTTPVLSPAVAAGAPKVAVIVLENKTYDQIVGNASAPYMNGLITQGLSFTDYHALQPGSAANYRGMVAGTVAPVPPVPQNLFNAMDAAGRPWLSLEESMTGNCGVHNAAKVPGTGQVLYVSGHDPAYVMRNNNSCATNDVPLTTDAQLSSLPEFTLIVPNACDDMHTYPKTGSCPAYFGANTGANFIKIGDNWLAHVVPLLLADPNMTVIVTYDEGLDTSQQHIYTVEVGAGVDAATIDTERYDHYSLEAALYGYLGLGIAPNHGATAVPLPIAPSGARPLSVEVQGPGSVTSSPVGIDCGSGTSGTCDAAFAKGSQVTLTATPDTGEVFDGWGGDCSGTGDCVLSMDTALDVTALFGPTATLTVELPDHGVITSDIGGIDCPGTCSHVFAVGTQVQLTTETEPGWALSSWSGPCDDISAPVCALTLSEDASVGALYAPQTIPTYSLDVTIDGTGHGVVKSDTGAIDCPTVCADDFDEDTIVTLSAHPGPNSDFTGWSGACNGTSATCEVTMDDPESVNATFDAAPDVQTIDDDDPPVSFNGWHGVSDAGAVGGAYRVSGVANDKATWTSAKATSLTWTSHAGPAGGKATVTIDGKSKGTVDLYAAAGGRHVETFSGLTSKAHTVVVKVTGTKNAASSGTEVSIDAFASGGASTPESDRHIKYDVWAGAASAHALGGTYRTSAAKTSTVAISFSGTEIDWIASKGPAYGKASVTIDGSSAGTVDLYRASVLWQAPIVFDGLAAGPHTLVIKVLGTKAAASTGTKVVIDGFLVS
jgi:hypothetical protein